MPIEREELHATVRGLLRLFVSTMIQNQALQRAFLDGDPIGNTVRLKSHLDTVGKELQPLLDSLNGPTPPSVEDILRAFEGPVN